MKPVLVLQHQDDVAPGNLGEWLTVQGIPFVVQDVTAQGPHDETDWGAVVVLGSKESAYDASVPWLEWERTELRRHLDAGRPLLGICFGAQLLAQLTGGSVAAARSPERGWIDVEGSPLTGSWFAWHGDEITVPPQAQVLARSSACVQAFQVGPHLGVQFHPEVSLAMITGWLAENRRQEQLSAVDSTIDTVLAESAARAAEAEQAAHRLYAGFFGFLLRSPDPYSGLTSR
ncbi:type 1 glutamine amidotransferase [Kineosporia babensis]|uniref:Type 1 glutamine amidotransferase n=1 Tax=Kineosporia babensis TaxID=499548 RepID=A0A9X1NB92_9ACTN|nr:type 1 glutamine amidotransferase [Kineosporia babensis]MCD5310530.1 type 1 glutamine amidotransferase [Kineosporia babensis]